MNLSFHESRDWLLAWHISQHPAIVDGVTDDAWGALDLETRECHVKLLVENPENHLLLVQDESGLMHGCFLLDKKDASVFEVHTMLLPAIRGMQAIDVGRRAAAYMLNLDGVEKLVSQCPMNCRQILFYALRCGFHKAGEASMTWMKAGQLFPLQMVEMTRKDLLCH